jgi:hypothetical protein
MLRVALVWGSWSREAMAGRVGMVTLRRISMDAEATAAAQPAGTTLPFIDASAAAFDKAAAAAAGLLLLLRAVPESREAALRRSSDAEKLILFGSSALACVLPLSLSQVNLYAWFSHRPARGYTTRGFFFIHLLGTDASAARVPSRLGFEKTTSGSARSKTQKNPRSNSVVGPYAPHARQRSMRVFLSPLFSPKRLHPTRSCRRGACSRAETKAP